LLPFLNLGVGSVSRALCCLRVDCVLLVVSVLFSPFLSHPINSHPDREVIFEPTLLKDGTILIVTVNVHLVVKETPGKGLHVVK
jgi:hypothetical protein